MTATITAATRGGALALLVLLALLARAGAAAGQDSGAAGSAAFRELSDCLQDRRHLLLAVVIDESGSLRDSDPDDRRVSGLDNALRSLAGRAEDGYRIEVLFSGFSTAYAVHGGWLTLSSESGTAIDQATQAYAGRDGGGYTDFVRALDGAQGALSAKAGEVAAAGGREPCRALLFFTDGTYDVADDAREPAGQRAVCDPGGVADQLRSVGTTIIAIGLTTGQEQAGTAFLEAIADPTPPGAACGARMQPPGVYIPVTDVDQLVPAFDRLGAGTPTDPATVGCCTQSFQLSDSLRGFRLLIDTGAAAVTAELRSPGAPEPLVLATGQRGSTPLGSARIAYRPASDVHIVVDGQLPPRSRDWVGTWTVTFVDPGGQHTSAPPMAVTLIPGLTPVADPPRPASSAAWSTCPAGHPASRRPTPSSTALSPSRQHCVSQPPRRTAR